MKEKKKYARYAVTVTVFLGIIFGVSAAGILTKDRTFSDTENRTLAQFPEFSWENLKSGDFTEGIEDYMSDQLFMKDEFVSLKTFADRLLMKSYQNGVYFGEDGYYLQDYQENKALVESNIEVLNDFAEAVSGQAEVSMLLAPNSISVMADKLPKVTQTDSQLDTAEFIKEKLSDKITLCFPYEQLKSAADEGTQVFYRTDHHWTADGAKIAFDSLMETMGESAPDVNYVTENLEGFYGTLYSKAPYSGAQPDTVTLYTNPENSITVTYSGDGGDNSTLATAEDITVNSLFDDEYKTAKDKYKTFLGGNFDLLEIETQGESDENVLVIKDSYANSVMPYLCDKYKHISVIDMRYYHMEAQTVSEYVKEHNITKVIYIYNIDFINSDSNFVWLD